MQVVTLTRYYLHLRCLVPHSSKHEMQFFRVYITEIFICKDVGISLRQIYAIAVLAIFQRYKHRLPISLSLIHIYQSYTQHFKALQNQRQKALSTHKLLSRLRQTIFSENPIASYLLNSMNENDLLVNGHIYMSIVTLIVVF